MSSFFKNLKDVVEKAPKAIKHARDEVIGKFFLWLALSLSVRRLTRYLRNRHLES